MSRHEKTALIWMSVEGGINRFRCDRLSPQCHGLAVVSTLDLGGDVR